MFRDGSDGLYGFKDWDGSIKIPAIYLEAKFFSEDLGAVKFKNNLWGYIDCDGKTIIAPQFTDALSFNESVAAIYENDNWGFIDKRGNVIIKPAFEEVNDFNVMSRFWGGYARMIYQHKMCYIDKKGKIIWSAP